MNPITHQALSDNRNSRCAGLTTLAERELTAFFNAVTQSFGSEQAELSARDWLQELIQIDVLPASARELRLITAKAATRLANRVNPSSLTTELAVA